jgi:hypothetical protein
MVQCAKGENAEKAFKTLNNAMYMATTQSLPKAESKYGPQSDAHTYAIRVVQLHQHQGGERRVIVSCSRKRNCAEKQYSKYNSEPLAIDDSGLKWHYYLYSDQYCKVHMEHGLLRYIVPIHNSIIKKYFRPGGMTPSARTRSVRAVRDTPVADYSAPGVNSTRRVPYRPLMAVATFLRVLSVSYCKRSLWRCR